ncbi:uncharacterized protein LOC135682881 [Rhopilema esculentum]|uniref:uncharacterized protein LOC135682881 n=1 Tax=Rhopilema esculentum TaxID=499914 RepID=UPI0031DDB376
MRNKKLQSLTVFDVGRKHHVLKAQENTKKSPVKKPSPKFKRKLSFPPKKPGILSNKKFFLDLQGSAKASTVKDIILQLGGILEEFNSKEVYCIVTNRFTIDEIIQHRNQSKSGTPSPLPGPVPSPVFAPVPSPLQQLSSNKCPLNSPLSTDSPQTQQSLDPKGLSITRGKSLLSKAVNGTQKQGSSNLLQLAQKWGTKVLHLEQFLKWTKEKKVAEFLQPRDRKSTESSSSSGHGKTSTFRVKKLKSPFIRVEDKTRKYRPFFLELGEWPSIFFESNSGSCPFEKPTEKHAFAETVVQTSDKETNEDGSSKNMSENVSEKQQEKPLEPHVKRIEAKEDVRNGYCECCSVRFNDISKHLKSDQHRAYARNDSNYADLDSVIQQGFSFDDFLSAVRDKYKAAATVQLHAETESPSRKNIMAKSLTCDQVAEIVDSISSPTDCDVKLKPQVDNKDTEPIKKDGFLISSSKKLEVNSESRTAVCCELSMTKQCVVKDELAISQSSVKGTKNDPAVINGSKDLGDEDAYEKERLNEKCLTKEEIMPTTVPPAAQAHTLEDKLEGEASFAESHVKKCAQQITSINAEVESESISAEVGLSQLARKNNGKSVTVNSYPTKEPVCDFNTRYTKLEIGTPSLQVNSDSIKMRIISPLPLTPNENTREMVDEESRMPSDEFVQCGFPGKELSAVEALKDTLNKESNELKSNVFVESMAVVAPSDDSRFRSLHPRSSLKKSKDQVLNSKNEVQLITCFEESSLNDSRDSRDDIEEGADDQSDKGSCYSPPEARKCRYKSVDLEEESFSESSTSEVSTDTSSISSTRCTVGDSSVGNVSEVDHDTGSMPDICKEDHDVVCATNGDSYSQEEHVAAKNINQHKEQEITDKNVVIKRDSIPGHYDESSFRYCESSYQMPVESKITSPKVDVLQPKVHVIDSDRKTGLMCDSESKNVSKKCCPASLSTNRLCQTADNEVFNSPSKCLPHSPSQKSAMARDAQGELCVFSSPTSEMALKNEVNDILVGLEWSSEKQMELNCGQHSDFKSKKSLMASLIQTEKQRQNCGKKCGVSPIHPVKEDFNHLNEVVNCSPKSNVNHNTRKGLDDTLVASQECSDGDEVFLEEPIDSKVLLQDIDHQYTLCSEKKADKPVNEIIPLSLLDPELISQQQADVCEVSSPIINQSLMESRVLKNLLFSNRLDSDCNLINDVSTFLDDDLRKGVTMHERLKMRKRNASCIASISTSGLATPKQPRKDDLKKQNLQNQRRSSESKENVDSTGRRKLLKRSSTADASRKSRYGYFREMSSEDEEYVPTMHNKVSRFSSTPAKTSHGYNSNAVYEKQKSFTQKSRNKRRSSLRYQRQQCTTDSDTTDTCYSSSPDRKLRPRPSSETPGGYTNASFSLRVSNTSLLDSSDTAGLSPAMSSAARAQRSNHKPVTRDTPNTRLSSQQRKSSTKLSSPRRSRRSCLNYADDPYWFIDS